MKKKARTKYRPICFYCGGVLCWDSSSNRNEDDDSIVDYWHCTTCGYSYEAFEPNEEEKMDYKNYWEKSSQSKQKKENGKYGK